MNSYIKTKGIRRISAIFCTLSICGLSYSFIPAGEFLIKANVIKKITLGDGEVFSVGQEVLKQTHLGSMDLDVNSFNVNYSNLGNTPIVLRSYEKNGNEFEALKILAFDILTQPEFYMSNYLQDKSVGWTLGRSKGLTTEYTTSHKGIDFFYYSPDPRLYINSIMKLKSARTVVYQYVKDSYSTLYPKIPLSCKRSVNQVLVNCIQFLSTYDQQRPRCVQNANNKLHLSIGHELAFLFRRIENNNVPVSELLNFFNELKKLSSNLGSSTDITSTFLFNVNDIQISDGNSFNTMVNTLDMNNTLYIEFSARLEVKVLKEGNTSYYQFQNNNSKEIEFLGLYDSNLKAIRLPDKD